MDSDMARAHGQHYDQDPLHPVEGGVEEVVPEKKSMFKRMKAKARKVKDSIGNKMHGSSSDHSQVEDEESDDDEDVAKQSKDPSPVYDSEPRNFPIAQEGKPTGPAEDLDQIVCPGTFQTKVTDPDHHDPPTAVPPKFGAKDDASEPKDSLGEEYPSVPKHQPRVVSPPSYETSVNEPKPAPTDVDTRYGEHWGSFEATSDDAERTKSTSGDVNSGPVKSVSGEVNTEPLNHNSGDISEPLTTTSGDFNAGRLNATPDDYNSEAFNATPEDFNSGRLNATSGGFKSGDFNPMPLDVASEDANPGSLKSTSGDFNSAHLKPISGDATSDDFSTESFKAPSGDSNLGQLNANSGGFKSGDFNPMPLDVAPEDVNPGSLESTSGDFNLGHLKPISGDATSDDFSTEAFNAPSADSNSGQLNANSGGFKSGDFNPGSVNADTHDFNSGRLRASSGDFSSGELKTNSGMLKSNSGDFGSESSRALGSDDLSSGRLRGASGGFSSFNSEAVRATSGELNSPLKSPSGEHLEQTAASGEDFGEYPTAPKPELQDDYPPKHETKDTDLGEVGSEEAKDDPISSSFAKMGIHSDQQREPETHSLKSGGHDQFCDQVESSPIPDFLSDKANTIPENTEAVPPVPESFSPKTENRPQDKDVDISYPKDVDVDAHRPQDMDVDAVDTPAPATNQGGYISSAASAVASKFGYGGNKDNSSDVPSVGVPQDKDVDTSYPKDVDVDVDAHHPQDMDVDAVDTPAPATNQGGYISSAASAVASKFGYGGNKDNSSDVPSAGVPVASTDDAVADRSPVETPQQQGGYVSSITGTAASAKNAVASKLGYGGSDNIEDVKSPREVTGAPISATDDVVTDRSPTSTPQPQGGYISSATSALAGTAMSAKNAVASKFGYGGSDSTATKETSRGLDDTSAPTETESGKGVKRYISEKLKPGEDDKALSDYIFGASHKPKDADEEEKEEKAGVGQTVSDAFHKRNDEDRDLDKPMGKVTESDQVADRLGSSESERTGVSSPGAESPSTGMVGKFKGAFTNWFAKPEETNPSPHSPVQGTTEEHGLKKASEENASYEEERKH